MGGEVERVLVARVISEGPVRARPERLESIVFVGLVLISPFGQDAFVYIVILWN